MTVKAKGKRLHFEKLCDLEFDSYRKCMSVVVRDARGRIHVLCKGAEVRPRWAFLPQQK